MATFTQYIYRGNPVVSSPPPTSTGGTTGRRGFGFSGAPGGNYDPFAEPKVTRRFNPATGGYDYVVNGRLQAWSGEEASYLASLGMDPASVRYDAYNRHWVDNGMHKAEADRLAKVHATANYVRQIKDAYPDLSPQVVNAIIMQISGYSPDISGLSQADQNAYQRIIVATQWSGLTPDQQQSYWKSQYYANIANQLQQQGVDPAIAAIVQGELAGKDESKAYDALTDDQKKQVDSLVKSSAVSDQTIADFAAQQTGTQVDKSGVLPPPAAAPNPNYTTQQFGAGLGLNAAPDPNPQHISLTPAPPPPTLPRQPQADVDQANAQANRGSATAAPVPPATQADAATIAQNIVNRYAAQAKAQYQASHQQQMAATAPTPFLDGMKAQASQPSEPPAAQNSPGAQAFMQTAMRQAGVVGVNPGTVGPGGVYTPSYTFANGTTGNTAPAAPPTPATPTHVRQPAVSSPYTFSTGSQAGSAPKPTSTTTLPGSQLESPLAFDFSSWLKHYGSQFGLTPIS